MSNEQDTPNPISNQPLPTSPPPPSTPSDAPMLCGVSRILSLLALVIIVGLHTIGWSSSFVQGSLQSGGGLSEIWTPSALLGLVAIFTGHLGLGKLESQKGRLTTIIGLVVSYIMVLLWILMFLVFGSAGFGIIAACILGVVISVSRRLAKK